MAGSRTRWMCTLTTSLVVSPACFETEAYTNARAEVLDEELNAERRSFSFTAFACVAPDDHGVFVGGPTLDITTTRSEDKLKKEGPLQSVGISAEFGAFRYADEGRLKFELQRDFGPRCDDPVTITIELLGRELDTPIRLDTSMNLGGHFQWGNRTPDVSLVIDGQTPEGRRS